MGRVSFDFDVISGPTPPRKAEPSAGPGAAAPPHDPRGPQAAATVPQAPADAPPAAATALTG